MMTLSPDFINGLVGLFSGFHEIIQVD